MSDKALNHAAYLSKISGAEIVVLNVIEDVVIPPSTLLTFIKSDISVEKAKDALIYISKRVAAIPKYCTIKETKTIR
jgi:hypothetical protein